MERIHQLQKVATEKIQEWQKALDAKGYAHLDLGVAAGLMCFVFCPMTIVAVAATYWTLSTEVQGATMSAKASLWDVSLSTEIQGASSESSMKMCSDEMPTFDDCAFSPKLKPTAALHRKILIAGLSLAAVVLLWNFLSVCLAASIDMNEGYNLNGAGFVFLVLELFFVTFAIVLVVCTMTRWSATTQQGAESTHVGAVRAQPPIEANAATPTLLTVTAANAPAESGSTSKVDAQVIAEQNNEATV